MTENSSTKSSKKSFILLKAILPIVVIFISHNIYSQRAILNGKISTSEDIDVEGINIFNRSSNKGSITDAFGEFQIAVSLNDTISISAIHIQTTTIIIGAEQLLNKKITINLSEKMNELSAVTLRRGLTGYLGTDANIIPTTEPITTVSVGLSTGKIKPMSKEERLLYAANSGPVDALVNMISGRTKILKKQLELANTSQLTETLYKKFPETYFTDALKIGKFQIYSFLFFCEDDPDYKNVLKRSNVEIIGFLERKSEEYRLGKGDLR